MTLSYSDYNNLYKNKNHSIVTMKIRRVEPKDIVEGNEVILVGDYNQLFVLKIEEVLFPNDRWKAFCADDGCRYGLEDTWVIEE